jgi:uncharacterized membrane protein (Fun14 family)
LALSLVGISIQACNEATELQVSMNDEIYGIIPDAHDECIGFSLGFPNNRFSK